MGHDPQIDDLKICGFYSVKKCAKKTKERNFDAHKRSTVFAD